MSKDTNSGYEPTASSSEPEAKGESIYLNRLAVVTVLLPMIIILSIAAIVISSIAISRTL